METSYLKDRLFTATNLEQFGKINKIERLFPLHPKTPEEDCYILRMLIKAPCEGFKFPEYLDWAYPIIKKASLHQEKLGIRHPFCYLTIRSGTAKSKKDDEWHVDGFTARFHHLPEQNYIWTDKFPTEYVEQVFCIPSDFDPLIHNLHWFFEDNINESKKKTCDPMTMYVLDPYIVHRRPSFSPETKRTFVRVTFCQMEIMDVNNTPNPFIPRDYTRDAVKEFRDNLTRYYP